MSDLTYYDPNKVSLAIDGVRVPCTDDYIQIIPNYSKKRYWDVLATDNEKTKLQISGIFNDREVVYTLELFNDSEILKMILESDPYVDPAVLGVSI